jgi:protease I
MSKSIAIVATNGYEYSELTEPKKALEAAGHTAHVISLESGEIEAAHDDGSVTVDKVLSDTDPSGYDALVLPGGQINPDILRIKEDAMTFIKHFTESGKPIAAICHGPWTLIEADAVRGKKMTSWPSLKTDLVNAGADWVDEEVVTDGNIVTSRKPDDLPAFNEAFLALL